MSTNQEQTFTCQPVLPLRARLRLPALIASLCLGYAATGFADLYQWTDAQGTLHLGNDASEAPADSRTELRVSPANTPKAGKEPAAALVSPRHQYAARSQGAFAQQLALDLGLIRHGNEDALGPLSGAGIARRGTGTLRSRRPQKRSRRWSPPRAAPPLPAGWLSRLKVRKPWCARPPHLISRQSLLPQNKSRQAATSSAKTRGW